MKSINSRFDKWIQNHIKLNRQKCILGIIISLVWLTIAVAANISAKGLTIPFAIIIISSVDLMIDTRSKWVKVAFECIVIVLLSFSVILLSQYINDANIRSLSPAKIIYGMTCCIILYLSFLAITMNVSLSLISAAVLPMVLATANYYVFSFRGNEFIPSDILAWKTALNVIGRYNLIPNKIVLYGWGALITLLLSIIAVHFPCIKHNREKKWKSRVSLLVVDALLILLFALGTADIYIPHFQNGGTWGNGYILNFVLSLRESFVTRPNDYSIEFVDSIAVNYSKNENGITEEYPHIIAIMNESLADFCILEDGFCDQYGVLSCFHELKENTIKGYALSSVFGGKTPNSEYEFLTGNTMAFLPSGSIPYQQFVDDGQYSMVKHLNTIGYECIAMHPYNASGWNRPNVYRFLGFTEFHSLEYFPQEYMLRSYVSDQELFDYIISQYEMRRENNPLFLFSVSMQNHGDYTYSDEHYRDTVNLKDRLSGHQDANQYLTVASKTDQAFKYLLDYFSNADDKVVVVLFGDHYPALDDSFYQMINGGNFNSLDNLMDLYKMPFVIWTNYDIEEEYVDCTSLNFLSNYLYQASGISLPPYIRFLTEIEETIPAMNSLGYYSKEKEMFTSYDNASGKESALIGKYRVIQYNSLAGLSDRNQIFFP